MHHALWRGGEPAKIMDVHHHLAETERGEQHQLTHSLHTVGTQLAYSWICRAQPCGVCHTARHPPLQVAERFAAVAVGAQDIIVRRRHLRSGAYNPALFRSTQAHFVRYVECMIFRQSIRQGDTGRCDQNGLG